MMGGSIAGRDAPCNDSDFSGLAGEGSQLQCRCLHTIVSFISTIICTIHLQVPPLFLTMNNTGRTQECEACGGIQWYQVLLTDEL